MTDPKWPTEEDLKEAEADVIYNQVQDEAHGR